MKAAAETTIAIAADPKRLGARIGVTAVLHTWGSTLTPTTPVFSTISVMSSATPPPGSSDNACYGTSCKR
jgi:hypothetical protein